MFFLRDIRTIGVVGSGQMGLGIAQVASQAEYMVLLFDISPESLERARVNIEKNLLKGVKLGKISSEAVELVLSRIKWTLDFSELAATDFVIESATENLELKVELFRRLDQETASDVILTTNTSSQSVTYLAGMTRRPGLVAGMHFFNPVHIMKLVEIIDGLETTSETLQIITSIAKRMGKETVIIKDMPGFATSRISAMLGNEAFYMLMDGLGTPEDIDKALKIGLNLPMGPLELGDLVGLDTRLKVLENMQQNLGERFRPCPLMRKYVEAGRYGKKVGKGVYDYPDK
ncbi:MAG: 3-hydroxybutyryl-CoA dehydrogenase [Desulfosporosinus sp. BRH_c37]|nr:MAG: 3-hydroxybutyryl-CoA dehydrogenase [Desulfosporosinus sp. BRH_c37]